ncbi:MAG: hypothetical protein RL088_1592 [Verrucomicrobiota bacterium]|jgi:hypothetical protein
MNHLPKVITTLFMALPWSYGHAFEKGALKDKTLVVWVSKQEK